MATTTGKFFLLVHGKTRLTIESESSLSNEPFATERSNSTDDPFAAQRGDDAMGEIPDSPDTTEGGRDRQMSKEWGTI